MDRLLDPAVQSCLGCFHLVEPLLELCLPLLRQLLPLLEGVVLALKLLLHAGGEGFPPVKGLPIVLQLQLGNSQLAGPLLQLLPPSDQGPRELVQLLLADLETLAAG